jgi:hypothetical protein
MSNLECTIAFEAEAYDWAAGALHSLAYAGLTATIEPRDGEPFTAELRRVFVRPDGPDEGYWKLTVAPYHPDGGADYENERTLDIYTEIRRVVIV